MNLVCKIWKVIMYLQNNRKIILINISDKFHYKLNSCLFITHVPSFVLFLFRFDGDELTTDERIRTLAQRWQPSRSLRLDEQSAKAVDTDMIILPCLVCCFHLGNKMSVPDSTPTSTPKSLIMRRACLYNGALWVCSPALHAATRPLLNQTP